MNLRPSDNDVLKIMMNATAGVILHVKSGLHTAARSSGETMWKSTRPPLCTNGQVLLLHFCPKACIQSNLNHSIYLTVPHGFICINPRLNVCIIYDKISFKFGFMFVFLLNATASFIEFYDIIISIAS